MHQLRDRLAVLAGECRVTLGALRETTLDVLEDQRDPAAAFLDATQREETSRQIRADAEGAEVHRSEVILRPPGQRNPDDRPARRHLDDRRTQEEGQRNSGECPEPELPRLAHFRSLANLVSPVTSRNRAGARK